MSMELLQEMNGKVCPCGKDHRFDTRLFIGSGVLAQLPEILQDYQAKTVFVLSDANTYRAAGQQVCALAKQAGVKVVSFSFPEGAVEPDEKSVGSAFLHFDSKCDVVIGVGSGVINDIGKILSCHSAKPYIIVGTAPSMDGYASASSSMTRDGLKISLPSKSADVIIGDTDILCQAPMHMMKSGLGDMIAKYISICEWRISHIITGEYYCEEVANLIRCAVKRCTDHAEDLLRRDPAAVQAVFEGLVIGGVAMNYAGLSRPASGVEHYISHIVDMRAVEFGTPMDLHGIQCAIGTAIALSAYEKLAAITPNREKALSYAKAFDKEAWKADLRTLLGKGAEPMIALEEKEQKYDLPAHEKRLEIILENWQNILEIMRRELPTKGQLDSLLRALDIPSSLDNIGTPTALLPEIFRATKDIRDKYVLSRLGWDLGVLDELI